jgi:hypothetical protein
VLDPAIQSHQAFLNQMQDEWDRAYEYYCRQEGKKKLTTHDFPWQPDKDKDGVETGLVTIRPKNKESFKGRDGETVQVLIDVLDAKKKRVEVEVGNDSMCRVAFTSNGFYTAGKFGLQFRLLAVQVLDHKAGGYDFGFDEEDGFEGEAAPPRVRHAPTAAAVPAHAAPASPADELFDNDNFAAEKDDDSLPF